MTAQLTRYGRANLENPMRIYAFVEYYPSAYKAYYDAQFADLVRKGHDVYIFAMGRLGSVLDERVVEYKLHDRTRYFYPDDLRSLPQFAPQLVRAAVTAPRIRASLTARVLAARHGVNGPKTSLKTVARMLTLPTEAPDLCLVNSHRTMALLPWLQAMYPSVPVALWYYGGEPQESGRIDDQRTRIAFAAADLVFTLTQFARDEAIERGADPENTFVVPIGFDIGDYKPADPRPYRRDGVLHLVSAGRLSEGKGHLYALKAIERLIRSGMQAIEYRIVGDGYMRPRLDEFVTEHGLSDYVRLDGTLANRDLIAALGRADALVLPSTTEGNWTETQGAVVQEALLMKALVVTTRTGGVPESIPDVMRPFCVPACDADSLADALVHVYGLNEHELGQLGEEGCLWAADHYDISMLNERLLEQVFSCQSSDSNRS